MRAGFIKYKGLTHGILPIMLCCAITVNHCFSQGTEIDIAGKRPVYLGWSIGPVKNNFTVHVNPGIPAPSVSNGTTLFSTLEAGYFITKNFGLSAGLCISSVKTNLTMPRVTHHFSTKDSEQEIYERRIDGINISEKQKITFLSIPIQLNLQLPLSKSVGFYIQSGTNISFPLNKSFNSTGTFTYTGYYPAYNVLITDIIYEGFQSNVKNEVSGRLQFKAVIPEFISSAGLQFLQQNRLQFSLGITYSKFIGNPLDYDSDNTFHLSTNPGQMQSIIEGADDVSSGSVGLKIAFRYYL